MAAPLLARLHAPEAAGLLGDLSRLSSLSSSVGGCLFFSFLAFVLNDCCWQTGPLGSLLITTVGRPASGFCESSSGLTVDSASWKVLYFRGCSVDLVVLQILLYFPLGSLFADPCALSEAAARLDSKAATQKRRRATSPCPPLPTSDVPLGHLAKCEV